MLITILLALSQHVAIDEIQGFYKKVKETFTQEGENLQIKEVKRIEEISAFDETNSLIITDVPEFFDAAYVQRMAGVAYLHSYNEMKIFTNASYAVMGLGEVDYAYLNRVYERFHNIPWKILRTKRCLVREMTLEDLDVLYEIYADKNITTYMEDLYEDKDEEKAYMEKYIHNMYGFYGFGMWMIQRISDGKLLGRAGLSVRDGFEDVELGYVIRADEQGNGYAKEVCMAILDYARDELEVERVNAFVSPDNMISKRFCEKLGFVKDGEQMIDNKVHDFYVWRR